MGTKELNLIEQNIFDNIQTSLKNFDIIISECFKEMAYEEASAKIDCIAIEYFIFLLYLTNYFSRQIGGTSVEFNNKVVNRLHIECVKHQKGYEKITSTDLNFAGHARLREKDYDCIIYDNFVPIYFCTDIAAEKDAVLNSLQNCAIAFSNFSIFQCEFGKVAFFDILSHPINFDIFDLIFYSELFNHLISSLVALCSAIWDNICQYKKVKSDFKKLNEDLFKIHNVKTDTPNLSAVTDADQQWVLKTELPKDGTIPNNEKFKNKNNFFSLLYAFSIIFIVSAVIYMICNAMVGSRNADSEPESIVTIEETTPARIYAPPVPRHGYFFYGENNVTYGDEYTDALGNEYAPFTIMPPATGDTMYYIKMNGLQDTYTFFVKSSNATLNFNVRCGFYTISYACGNTWYGSDELFGEETKYFKCDDVLHFYQDDNSAYGNSITLYKVPNGNMDVEELSADEF